MINPQRLVDVPDRIRPADTVPDEALRAILFSRDLRKRKAAQDVGPMATPLLASGSMFPDRVRMGAVEDIGGKRPPDELAAFVQAEAGDA